MDEHSEQQDKGEKEGYSRQECKHQQRALSGNVDELLEHIIRRRHDSRIGLVSELASDHVHKLSLQVNVGELERIRIDAAPSTGIGCPHCCRLGV